MARAAKRSKTTSSPQRMGQMRSSSTVRAINFPVLAEALTHYGPGQPEDVRREVYEIQIDTKFAIFDFCGLMGAVLYIDLFHPSPTTIIKLRQLRDTLDDMRVNSEKRENREQASKAKRIFTNFIKYYEDMYFYEVTDEEKVIALTGFFLDFGDKIGVGMGDLMKACPKGQYL